jgi:predicted DNA-binding transcriptional regulator AlpA
LVWAVQDKAGGQALSISQFCARNNISRSFFYKLKKRRKAPRIMDVGGRQIISPEAERDWRLERETAAAARRLASHNTTPTKDEEDLGSK